MEPDRQAGLFPILPQGIPYAQRLREFRKAIPDVTIEFISFNSPEGEKLLTEMKSFARQIIVIETDNLN